MALSLLTVSKWWLPFTLTTGGCVAITTNGSTNYVSENRFFRLRRRRQAFPDSWHGFARA